MSDKEDQEAAPTEEQITTPGSHGDSAPTVPSPESPPKSTTPQSSPQPSPRRSPIVFRTTPQVTPNPSPRSTPQSSPTHTPYASSHSTPRSPRVTPKSSPQHSPQVSPQHSPQMPRASRPGRGRGGPTRGNHPGPRRGRGRGRMSNIQKVIQARRLELLQEEMEQKKPEVFKGFLPDPYANATAANYITRGKTGYVWDLDMLKHICLWDPDHAECPDRVLISFERCVESGLLDFCIPVANPLRTDVRDCILLVHSLRHYERLQNMCLTHDVFMLEQEASRYDSVYFNHFTFDAAYRAVSACLNLCDGIMSYEVQNGFAFVRPPGHHAMYESYNGYCFFNNVAIAAEYMLTKGFCKKIMIVDIDVHHGQGTQQIFYERKDVLYFSIHRYEHGTFWPNLVESGFNFIGRGEGLGYNINVPLNTTGLTDDDYYAILFSILLPVGYEKWSELDLLCVGLMGITPFAQHATNIFSQYAPDMILLSAGYDAALGCPEGRMEVTPGFYAHLVHHLSALGRGKMAVFLEGGYFLPSLSEGIVQTIKGLLGAPCPPIQEGNRGVHPSVTETICNVRRMLQRKWRCFMLCELSEFTNDHNFEICYFGNEEQPPFPTRFCYPMNTLAQMNHYALRNQAMIETYKATIITRVGYATDPDMLKHRPPNGQAERPERPERITRILDVFREYGLFERLVAFHYAVRDFTQYSPHAEDHFSLIGPGMPETRDIYCNDDTRRAVALAVSGILEICDGIMKGAITSGIAVIRPPGHHADFDTAQGFCFINNVAVAANYMLTKYHVNKILIVDFDIHHGNGTQNIFYSNKNVMYISIHRDDDGKFYPAWTPRSVENEGHGVGRGFNVNIPFSNDKMGDTEYILAFHNIILPIAYSYAPQVVIVSAGFDAGINDPMGNYNVSPETFGHFVHMLKPLAEGRLILALEGGYNVTTTAYSMGICAKTLLGDPLLMPKKLYEKCSPDAMKTIKEVIEHFKRYYPMLDINKNLSLIPVMARKVDHFTNKSYLGGDLQPLDPDRITDSTYVEEHLASFNLPSAASSSIDLDLSS